MAKGHGSRSEGQELVVVARSVGAVPVRLNSGMASMLGRRGMRWAGGMEELAKLR